MFVLSFSIAWHYPLTVVVKSACSNTQPKRCNRGSSKSINWKGARFEHWKVFVETYLLDKDAQLHMATEALESPSKIADDDRILLDTLLCQWVFLLKWFNLHTRIWDSTRYFTITPEDEQNKETGRIRWAGASTLLGHVTSIPRSILIACRSQYKTAP